MDYITDLLRERADKSYADFHSRLVPNVERERIIGVRTPDMRALAKALKSDENFCRVKLPEFLDELPHHYYDEMVLHGELISLEKDFDKAIRLAEEYLKYADNWAECDLLSPKVFSKHKPELYQKIKSWLNSEYTYIVRFGICMLMKYFLDENFDALHLRLVRDARGEDYYIKMAKAWYYSVALVKHYDEVLSFIKNELPDEWVLKKSVQKARESFRLSSAQKEELKSIIKHD